MLNHLCWHSFQTRREDMKAIMMFKIVNCLVDIPKNQLSFTSTMTQGHYQRYRPLYPRVDVYKYSFFPTAIHIWNNLPEDVVNSADIDTFRANFCD